MELENIYFVNKELNTIIYSVFSQKYKLCAVGLKH